ncbi:AfsR family transcriptional regulator [Streptomyces sp. XM4193]|uniref:BTAD domain-containing putative transcriptional regulator n=1 Tax=Streptomyces sp. XM4193 TaxID=2929782 RepID=UPI001FF843FC|nr:BTAD domain-containing putative transcriptional regulator [Streptomyces sp. XM4193]MCK1796178.1 AfsR family transcriptional regulator [Streptomyces sp. XM4193]
MGYRYQILGTTRVHRDDGSAVPIGGARLRALLTALALTPGQDVRTDALIAAVWADSDPPADAQGALQALVGRLRRALDHSAIASGGGGYRLVAEPAQVDAGRFEQLADAGSRALLAGDAAGAVELLDEALGLWQGSPYADLPDAGGAAAVRAEAGRLEAARTRAEARVALGEAGATLADLAVLCAEHPLDEPLQALRLRALRDAGRPAEALATYEAVRTELAELLGADPGPELRALHAQLLTQAVPQTLPAADPEAAGGPSPAEPAEPVRPPGNLPTRLTSFVGREEELAAIRTELGAFRLVTLLGPGGAGKTRLSLEAAEALAAQWPDGVWLAELAPVREAATVPETVLTALGGRDTASRATAAHGLRTVTDSAPPDPLAELAELCVGRRMLLLLDNCEHVVDAAAQLAETLLVQCPAVTVLATSREPLGVAGESVLVVDPLPQQTAERLLEERGAAGRTGFRAAQDPEAVAEICRRLDGLPLAIELAAARLRSLTPRQLADRLDDRFRLLNGGSRTALPRQQTLRAVVDWSWELLDTAEREVLRRLAVFSGGVALEQAEHVCGGGGVDTRDVAVVLGSLVDKSLLVPVVTPDGAMRYRLLETVAEYAAERLDESAERTAVERRHLVCYRELARTARRLLRGPEQLRELDRLEREHDNIRAALHRAVDAGDEQEALSLTLSMGWFWQLRNHRGDARQWCAATAALGPDPFATGRPAPDVSTRCTDVPPPLDGELLPEARRQVRMLGLAVADQSELDDERQVRLVRAVIDSYRPDQPQVCHSVGPLWYYARLLAGEVESLRDDLDRTVAGCRKLDDDWELASALRLRSRLRGGATPELRARAVADADESLELFGRLGDGWGIAEALSGRSEIREADGELTGAIEDLREGVRIAGELGDLAQEQLFRARLGNLLVEDGRAEEGERLLRRTLAEGDRLGSDTLTLTRIYLATLLGRTGRTGECRGHLDALLAEFVGRREQQRLVHGMVDALYGWLELLDGRPEQARTRLLLAAERVRHPVGRLLASELAGVTLLHGSEAAAALDRPSDAASLLGAFDARHGAQTPRLSLLHQECRARAERAARSALPATAYEEAYRGGAELSLSEAIGLI